MRMQRQIIATARDVEPNGGQMLPRNAPKNTAMIAFIAMLLSF